LHVDDDAFNLDQTSYILRREGIVVEVTVDGRDAVRRCEDVNPDIVLLDIPTPSVDGFEMIRRLRATTGVPTVVLSKCADVQEIVRGLRMGADDYITKPFNPAELVARIEAVLRRARNGSSKMASKINAGDILLDTESHEVRRGPRRFRATPLEYRMLY